MPTFGYIILLVTTSLFFLTNEAHANIITLSPGIAYAENSGTQTLQLQNSPQDLSNQYIANNNWNSTFALQLFLGKEFLQREYTKLHLGLTLGYFDDIQQNGFVNQFALPDFDNLNYQYKIKSISAMASLKMFFTGNQQWQPYIDGGVGFSNNAASDYKETPRILGAEPMSPFGNHSRNSFAYSIGAGFMYDFHKSFSVGLGYQFVNLGKAQLGTSVAQQTTQTPSVNHVLLHQLLVNITWNT